MIATGVDHLLALDKDGKVWAMGNDTFGQCGQGGDSRSSVAPFFEVRHAKPVKVPIPTAQKVVKIVSGFRHCLAITADGKLFGWGFNSMMQLSNAADYIDPENSKQAIFNPAPILGPLDKKFVTDAAAGEEHTVVVC